VPCLAQRFQQALTVDAIHVELPDIKVGVCAVRVGHGIMGCMANACQAFIIIISVCRGVHGTRREASTHGHNPLDFCLGAQ
jgi:hypothetical protein